MQARQHGLLAMDVELRRDMSPDYADDTATGCNVGEARGTLQHLGESHSVRAPITLLGVDLRVKDSTPYKEEQASHADSRTPCKPGLEVWELSALCVDSRR